MTTPIQGLTPFVRPDAVGPLSSTSSGDGRAEGVGQSSDFGRMLFDAIESTTSLENQAHVAIEDHVTGGDVETSEVFAAIKKADLALRTMIQVRNKLLEAYDEIQQLRM